MSDASLTQSKLNRTQSGNQRAAPSITVDVVHAAFRCLTLGQVCRFGLFNEEQLVQFFGRGGRWSFRGGRSCSWFLCNDTQKQRPLSVTNYNVCPITSTQMDTETSRGDELLIWSHGVIPEYLKERNV